MDTGIRHGSQVEDVVDTGIRRGSLVEDDVVIDWSEIYVMIDLNCGK